MRKIVYVIFASILALAVACGPSASRQERFDRAMAEAESLYMQSDTLRDFADLDELIEYYRLEEASAVRQRAYYLRGYQYHLAGRYTDAIIDYLNAEHSAALLTDTIAIALADRAIGDVYTDLWDHASALDYYRKSAELFNKIESEKYSSYAQLDYAKAMYRMNLYEQADSVLKPLLAQKLAEGDSAIVAGILRIIGRLECELKDYGSSIKTFNLLQTFVKEPHPLDLEYHGLAYLYNNYIDSAEIKHEQIRQIGGGDHWLHYRLSVSRRDTSSMCQLMDTIYRRNYDLLEELSSRNFSDIANKYYATSNEYNNERIRHTRSIGFAIIGLLFLVLAAVITLYFIKRRIYLQENHRNILAINSLRQIVSEMQDSLNRVEQENKELVNNVREGAKNMLGIQTAPIQQILDTYSIYKDTKKQNTKIIEQVKQMFSCYEKEGDFFKSISIVLDKSLNNLLSRLLEQVPNFSDDDLHLYVLLVLGFSSNVLGSLLNLSTNQIYSRKGALKRKIKAKQPKDLDEFMFFLQ